MSQCVRDMAIDSKANPYVLGFQLQCASALLLLSQFYGFRGSGTEKYKQLRDFLFFSAFFLIILIRRYGRRCWVPRFWLRSQFLQSLTRRVAGYTSLALASYVQYNLS